MVRKDGGKDGRMEGWKGEGRNEDARAALAGERGVNGCQQVSMVANGCQRVHNLRQRMSRGQRMNDPPPSAP